MMSKFIPDNILRKIDPIQYAIKGKVWGRDPTPDKDNLFAIAQSQAEYASAQANAPKTTSMAARDQLLAQRAGAAGVRGDDNEADMLGNPRAKRRGAARDLVG